MKKIIGILLLILGVVFIIPAMWSAMKITAVLLSILYNNVSVRNVHVWEDLVGALFTIGWDIALFYFGTKLLSRQEV